MKRKEHVILWFIGCFYFLLLIYVVSVFIRAFIYGNESQEHIWKMLSAKDITSVVLTVLVTIFSLIYTQYVKNKSEYLEKWNCIKASGSYYFQFDKVTRTTANLKTIQPSDLYGDNSKSFLAAINIFHTGDSLTVFRFISAFDEDVFLKQFSDVDEKEFDGSSRSSYMFKDEEFFKFCSSHPEGTFPIAVAYPARLIDSNNPKVKKLLNDNALIISIKALKVNEIITIWLGGYSEDDCLIFIRAKIRIDSLENNTCKFKLIQEYPYYYYDGKIYSYTKGISDK